MPISYIGLWVHKEIEELEKGNKGKETQVDTKMA